MTGWKDGGDFSICQQIRDDWNTLSRTDTHTRLDVRAHTHTIQTPTSMEKTSHLNPARNKINNNKKEAHNAKKRQIWVKNMGQQ